MTSSVLVAFAGVFVIAAAGFVFAWIALTPVEPDTDQRPLEHALKRIERDVHRAQELIGLKR